MTEQPIFILPRESERTSGRDAQRMNIQAAKLVAEAVRTTLGPKGMDKMLVDSAGEVTVTNDGVTILEEMHVDHPCAKMIVEVAKTQEDEVGDGTTTAVVLAGELLGNAESLLEDGIHPTVIAKGYRFAAEMAQELLTRMVKPITLKDDTLLTQIATTAMTGKGVEDAKETLAKLVIEATRMVAQEHIHRADIHVEARPGGQIKESELIQGILLDKERLATTMPSQVKDARILLLDAPLEIRSTEVDARITITDPEKLQAFLDMEEQMLGKMVERIKGVGATVVCCQRGIDDLAAHYLARQGILAYRRVKRSDMERLEKTTSGKIVSDLDDLNVEDLGRAGVVEERRFSDGVMTFMQGCMNARAVTILVRGSTSHVIAEVKRALEDAIGDVVSAISSGKIVPGAGASELELARGLHTFALTLSGREQLAVRAFADAMEIIPRTLAENAGIDPIDALASLKAAHDEGKPGAGIDVVSGDVMDAWQAGVVEPLAIKTQALGSASEVAVMILRIDDVISSGEEQMGNA